jgi:hypothetical protein
MTRDRQSRKLSTIVAAVLDNSDLLKHGYSAIYDNIDLIVQHKPLV